MRPLAPNPMTDLRPDGATGADFEKVDGGAQGGRSYDTSDDEFEIL